MKKNGNKRTPTPKQKLIHNPIPTSLFGWYLHLTTDTYKWKNHFSEMKGDVGMSPHEKQGEQEDAYTKTETHS